MVKVTTSLKGARSIGKTTIKWKNAFEKIKSSTMLPGVPEEVSSDAFFCESINATTSMCGMDCTNLANKHYRELIINM